MMTPEQCIEVAEKVMMFERKNDGGNFWRHPTENYALVLRELEIFITTWDSFGLTVEAMEEKGYRLGVNSYQVFGFYKVVGIHKHLGGEIDLGGLSFEWLEATHLAALEAMEEIK